MKFVANKFPAVHKTLYRLKVYSNQIYHPKSKYPHNQMTQSYIKLFTLMTEDYHLGTVNTTTMYSLLSPITVCDCVSHRVQAVHWNGIVDSYPASQLID